MAAVITENSLAILNARYVDKVHDKTVDGLWDRVSMGKPEYRKLLSDLLFLPNSPTLFNLGLPTGGTLSACFTADTIIHCLAGDFTVSEIREKGWKEFEVFSTDGKRLRIGKAFALRKTKTNARVYKVLFDTGEEIKLTADHLVMMRDGSYKEVRTLVEGDSVMPFNYSYQRDGKTFRRKVCPGISGRKEYCHRWAYQESAKKKIQLGCDIHHVNEDPTDDRPANLEELTHSEHASRHMMSNQKGVGPKPGTSAAMIGNQHALRTEPHPDPKRQYQREWARAKSRRLTEQRARERGGYNHKVVSVTYCGREDVYDLSVHKYHNFAANGVFIHNCFVFDIMDSLLGDWPSGGFQEPFVNSILGTTFKAACVAKAGGGVGYYLGNIRPEGSPVHSTHRKACGPVAVVHWLNRLRNLITQGGKRDLAQMGVLNADHADIRKFIHCKDEDPQALSSFNLSVSWRERMLTEAAGGGAAAALWREQCESAWRTGCPGMLFWDTINRANATPHLGDINATNPCGETPNISDEPCNLGSLAVCRYVRGTGASAGFMWDELEADVRTSIQYMDDILEANVFPHPDITQTARATRKLGLGVMGWADLLALLHIPYASTAAVDLASELMKTINRVALDESMKLAETKGAYPAWEGASAETKAKFPKARNSTRTSIAPTGTISIIAGVWGSIEPHYALECTRTTGEGLKMNDGVPEWVKDRLNGFGDFTPQTAAEVHWKWHIRHQAAFQKHTDLGVSKTINMPNDATVQDVSDAYRMMWETGCKGGTIFREGCRNEAVLVKKRTSAGVFSTTMASAKEEPNNTVSLPSLPVLPSMQRVITPTGMTITPNRRKLPHTRKSLTHKFRIGTTKVYLTVGLFEDGSPGEVFLSVGKQGSTVNGLFDSWAITLSGALQHGVPLADLVRRHKGTQFEPRGFTDNPAIQNATSIPDYIVRWMESQFLGQPENVKTEASQESGEFCPDCSSPLYRDAGCLTCRSPGCGFSKC